MNQSRWGVSRYTTLVGVLAAHAAVLAALLTAWFVPELYAVASPPPLELVYLTPPQPPKVRAEDTPPRRLSAPTALALAPPEVEAVSLSTPASATVGSGHGSGVDWLAEARRAMQAYEIRRTEHPAVTATFGSPAEENWWPRTRHQAGDQYKTPNGDWIVWISSSCYQIATAADLAQGTVLPQTVCPVTNSDSAIR
jgi:hypothetical protein